jgi:integrase
MSVFKRGNIWWYEFWFAGRRIQESTKSTSKTIAKAAEQRRRRELELGFNGLEDQRYEQVRALKDVAYEYLESYALRNRSAVFANYAVNHVVRLLGDRVVVDIDDDLVRRYQDRRLRDGAAPKSINEEVGFLLRLLGDRGELIRARMKKHKTLRLKGSKSVARAYSPEEKARLIEGAKAARSPAIYPALLLAFNAGLRSGEIRNLQWAHIDLERRFLIVGKSKTEAGEGRTIPLNPPLHAALEYHAQWYLLRFERIEPDWYLFPFGRSGYLDPTRPITSLQSAWEYVCERAGVKGRMHDSRHTLITELAESGAGDQTIMDIAGHVSRQMLKHYSHIRMEAKRDALDAIWKKQEKSDAERQVQSSQESPQRQGG